MLDKTDLGASRLYKLTPECVLPPQKVTLTVTKNKIQIIDMIVNDILAHACDFTNNELIVTGSDNTPVQIFLD